jgi:hypothetical protein
VSSVDGSKLKKESSMKKPRSVKPIEPGDYVQFAYLPPSMKVTPVPGHESRAEWID